MMMMMMMMIIIIIIHYPGYQYITTDSFLYGAVVCKKEWKIGTIPQGLDKNEYPLDHFERNVS